MDPTLDAMHLAATGWTALLGDTPVLGALVAVALVGGVALALAVAGGPRPDLTALDAPSLQPALAGRGWAPDFGNTGERPEASRVAVQPRTAVRAAAPSPPDPLTETDRVALAWLRARIRAGEVAEGPTAAQRLAFARWLAEHGRLST
jgi:hypothetical protein